MPKAADQGSAFAPPLTSEGHDQKSSVSDVIIVFGQALSCAWHFIKEQYLNNGNEWPPYTIDQWQWAVYYGGNFHVLSLPGW